mgnify:CR=1 FL=1
MHEALAEARRQLGDNTTILHTRQLETSGCLGLVRKQQVEIVAAVDAPLVGATSSREHQSSPTTGAASGHGHRPSPTVGAASSREHGSSRLEAAPTNGGEVGFDVDQMTREISELRRIVANMDSRIAADRPKEVSPVIERLTRNGVPDAIAEMLDSESKGDPAKAPALIARRITCSGGLQVCKGQSRVALIGPTGVGKTTTIAKLAAEYSLVHKKKVALLTLDTYRIGAVEQLATYARLLDIPLEVALSCEDVTNLIASHADKDLILIDTIGRSQRNREQLAELARFLRAADPTEVHLAVSASANSAAQTEAVSSFGIMSPGRIVLTKLDECPQPGCILSLASSSLLPYSYVTYGQDVPDDIAVAQSESLAQLVWEGAL